MATLVTEALETVRNDHVESHLHTTPTFDLAAHPTPSGREEIWRFTPLRRLGSLLDDVAPGGRIELQADVPAGVAWSTVTADEAAALGGIAPLDRLGALAALHAPQVGVLDIPADTELTELIRVRAIGAGTADAVAEHTVIRVGRHASARLLLENSGSAHYNEFVQVIVEDGARVDLVTINDWADDAVHTGQTNILVGRDAEVRHFEVTIGGDVVRTSTNVAYSGTGGAFEGFGLYFADAGQHIEHRLFVDHNQPKTSSNVVYKGALQGERAHTVWIGNILIRKVAEGIETYEENRNLILSDGAQADSVPNLEIETGEIAGAGHASATARFDDEQLFYLRSRGISEKEAQRLVVHGFFDDLIRRIGIAEVEDKLRVTVEAELAKNVLREPGPGA
ncbi:Fe-S cluster assembly protein SufD [Nocardioides sp. R-C-SC26]|uniref:Fe-S cluster assembly protein SufD n=1 Tax=Nocardioides sp. R-C-SC26 TaxID=2870414 RepID=UPI001E4B5900|nr:Fe-S cluster assembly protein SufD [Nocardioides sp. R-C-SC26]